MEVLMPGEETEFKQGFYRSYRRGSQRVGGLGRLAVGTARFLVSAAAGVGTAWATRSFLEDYSARTLEALRDQTPLVVDQVFSINSAVVGPAVAGFLAGYLTYRVLRGNL